MIYVGMTPWRTLRFLLSRYLRWRSLSASLLYNQEIHHLLGTLL
jgi:hypothetical protein